MTDTTTEAPAAVAPAAGDSSVSVKPGWQTTEFWLTLIGSLLGLLTALGVIGPDWRAEHAQAVQGVALALSLIAPLVYTVARSVVKTRGK